MLNFFTDPYPNELIYSAIGRYHHIMGNDIIKTNLDIYGVKKPTPVIYFSYKTNQFIKNLGGTYTDKEIIYSHSIYSFYKPFLTKEAQKECEDGMLDGNTDYIRRRLYNRIFNNKRLRYCPCCAMEDINIFGQAYFHVQHQLDGISICYEHNVLLYDYEDDKEWYNINNYVLLNENRINKNVIFNRDIMLYNIAKLAVELFEVNTCNLSKEKLKDYYRNVLYEMGYISHNGVVKIESLKRDIINFYTEEFLLKLESGLDNNKKDHWLKFLVSGKEKFIHPIRHILLISFFNKSIKNIVNNIDYRYSPFESDTLVCINKFCEFYNMSSMEIIKSSFSYNTKQLSGSFRCKHCGMTYKKIYNTVDKTLKFKEINDYGHVWNNKLRYYYDNGFNMNQIAIKMDEPYNVIKYNVDKLYGIYNNITVNNELLVQYKKIITDYILQNNEITRKDIYSLYKKEYKYIYNKDPEWFKNNIPKPVKAYLSQSERINLYRNCILDVLSNNPNISRVDLNNLLKKKYQYLTKHDKNWVDSKIPLSTKENVATKFIDWQERDIAILNAVKNKYNELSNKRTAVRISITLLNREIDDFPINNYTLSKCPKANQYIKSIIDTTESYRMKCYMKFIDNYYEKNNSIDVNDVIKKFDTLKSNDMEIINKLNEYIKQRTFL